MPPSSKTGASSRPLPIVIPNSANSHPELDSGSLYYLHPNAESSCLKLTTMRSLSPVEGWSLSQSKGRAKKNAPSSRIRFGFVKADGRAYTDAKSSSHDGVLSAKKSHHSVKSFRKENMYSDWYAVSLWKSFSISLSLFIIFFTSALKKCSGVT